MSLPRSTMTYTRQSWFLRLSESFGDIVLVGSSFFLVLFLLISHPTATIMPVLGVLAPMVAVYIFLFNKSQAVYALGLFHQAFLVLLLLPGEWMNPALLPLVSFAVGGLTYYSSHYYKFRFPYFLIFLASFWAIRTIFQWIEFDVDTGLDWSFSLLKDRPQAGIFFNYANPVSEGKLYPVSFLESFGVYCIALIYMGIFRSNGVWLVFLGQSFVAFLYSHYTPNFQIREIMASIGIWFFLYLSPGRNFRKAIPISVVTALLLSVVVWISMGWFGFRMSFFPVLFLYFALESLLIWLVFENSMISHTVRFLRTKI